MLQQTQTQRVVTKFTEFMATFPTLLDLVAAPLATVLAHWSGLGYNRRAVNLKKAAEIIVNQHHGQVPRTIADLIALPGIGPATAASIAVYAYDEPIAFIETNIRTVFLYQFFPDKTAVSDRDLLPLVNQTLDTHSPRRWFYALTDYGNYLKSLGQNNQSSRHFHRQSTFVGSDRQLRGLIIKKLLIQKSLSFSELLLWPEAKDKDVEKIILTLIKDELITRQGNQINLI